MQMLRGFFIGIDQLSNDFDDENSWKKNIGVSIATEIIDGKISQERPISDYFSRCSYQPVNLCDFETDAGVNCSVLRATTIDEMLDSLGFPEMALMRDHNQAAMLVSESHPIGWALYNRDMGFGRHIILEIGDDKNHIRLNIKDAFVGDQFNAQIDEITLFSESVKYSIPCREHNIWIVLAEEITGTIDLAVQALCNDDHEQAYLVFKDIERIKAEFITTISPTSWISVSEQKPTP